MATLNRIAFIGNSLPRRCGIATFTTDLHRAIDASRDDLETIIVAMTDHGNVYEYPSTVGFEINDDRRDNAQIVDRRRHRSSPTTFRSFQAATILSI